MKKLFVAAALAAAIPGVAFAQEAERSKECCCEKMKGEMGCCDKDKMKDHEQHEGSHDGYQMDKPKPQG